VAKNIREIADKTGVRVKGPQPLPTKTLKVTTRKAPTGEGSHTFDHWQLRIHRRILDVQPDDARALSLVSSKVDAQTTSMRYKARVRAAEPTETCRDECLTYTKPD
jgi:small subunit ribosomal protein S10